MLGVTHAIFALLLLLGPPEGEVPPADEPVLADGETSGEASYVRTREQLGHGITLGDERPKEAIAVIEEALTALPRFAPQLANDPEALALRAEAYVSLARAYLTVRDETKAREALDEGLRSAPFGQDLPVSLYGPRIEKLWKQMKAGESPRQDVEINCWVKCRVYLNERSVELSEPSEPILDDEFATRARLVDLKAGRYRLWIEAVDGSIEPLITEFEPREAGEPPLDFIFGTKPEPQPEPAPVEPPKLVATPSPVRDSPSPKPKKRLLPRGAEIAGIATGVGLVVAGAVLLSFDGKCSETNRRPNSDSTGATCGNIYGSTAAGGSLIGVGAGVLVISGLLLSVDQVRVGRERGRQVMVGVSFKF